MAEQGKSTQTNSAGIMIDRELVTSLRSVPREQRIITALDVADARAAVALARQLGTQGRFVKVGLELFSAAGPEVVRSLRELGKDVFLDLKYHDIPNTVASAARVAAALGAAMVTVHAAAGARALATAAETLAGGGGGPARPVLLAVTVLTSLSVAELAEVAPSPESLPERVLRLARLAVANGCDGIVCAAADLTLLRAELGTGPLVVTPGIRPTSTAPDDQRRVATPAAAMAAGADFLVIGRPITRTTDPAAALQAICRELPS